MARHVKQRDATSYRRDIEHIRRLRGAIVLDASLDVTQARAVVAHADKLIELLESLGVALRKSA
jgi:putative intracellular protease/amidase